jgi:hypothetical protein
VPDHGDGLELVAYGGDHLGDRSPGLLRQSGGPIRLDDRNRGGEMRYAVVTPEDQPDTYLVYYMVPSRNTLVASRSQSDGRDKFGSKYPAGDWCADGYELAYNIWPGASLIKVN